MPTYDYRCPSCGTKIEVRQTITAPDPRCSCGATMTKCYSPIAIAFRGSGFYRTDSRAASTA